jgi:hypothetical protein
MTGTAQATSAFPGFTVLPGFIDAHVHLALIDPAALASGGIARVLDLGGWRPAAPGPAPTSSRQDSLTPPLPSPSPTPTPTPSPTLTLPVELAPRARQGRPEVSSSAEGGAVVDRDGSPEIVYANQFLAPVGGYPARQDWAPAGSVREVTTTTDAAAAVDEQLAAGASVVKITLNSEAGPVFDAEVLWTIITRAHERQVPVVAHAQGVGQAVRAFMAGVDVLAHTPFSERLVDELVDAMAGRMAWISTLDIHGWGRYGDDFARASDNLRRFHAFGGQVLYGTDLGNGPLPTGVNRREIEALLAVGMSTDAVLGALTAEHVGSFRAALRAGAAGAHDPRVTVIPGERPNDPAGFVDWLCAAQAVSRGESQEPK